jgi:hypothetical protein
MKKNHQETEERKATVAAATLRNIEEILELKTSLSSS